MRLIDAEWLEELFPDTGEGEWTYNTTALGYIDSAPTIDAVPLEQYRSMERTCVKLQKAIDAVEVKHGHWKPHPIYPKEWDVCTSCGFGTKRREYGINPDGTEWMSEESYTYCPWCGAKMDEVME